MAARKLQGEIDRTIKKVAEGVELFEGIYEKMQSSTNQTQKEKMETDLKTQIKKLQRLRDQIKTWAASNDIKDKSQLLDNRRLIELQMEKFKACEKEMKTKAFSKVGLNASTKLDPKLAEKLEMTAWVQEKVEALQQQVEHTEAEVEALQAGGKKKKANSTADRLEALEALNERRKWNISRLEIILRLLDNGSMKAERIKDLQEDVAYFVDNNAEEDFEEFEGLYDELHLDEQEELWGLANENEDHHESESELASEDIPPRTPKKHDDDRETHKRDRDLPASPVLKKAGVTMHPRKPSASMDSKPPPNPNFSQAPMSSVVKSGLPASKPPTLPPIRYAAAAAAAVASPSTTTAPHPVSVHTPPSSSAAQPPAAPTAPSIPTLASVAATHAIEPSVSGTSSHDAASSPMLTHSSVVASPMMSTTSAHPDGSMYSARESPAISEAIAVNSPHRTNTVPESSQTAAPSHPLTNGTPALDDSTTPSSPLREQPQAAATGSAEDTSPRAAEEQSLESQMPALRSAVPSSLTDLVTSFESVKSKASQRMASIDQIQKILENGRATAPQASDADKPKYYIPRNPWPTPSYYTQTPLPLLDNPAIFSQLEVETLFYIFYFYPGSYKQYLAAQELKKQSWRFHIKYMTWFMRHSEPQAVTEDYEQGVYVYFDWEGSWCQRKKADFRFEYRYLSEE